MTERVDNRQLLVALGCVIDDEKVLLTRRYEPEQADLNSSWELPGGKVRLNETPEEAVIREVREEAGYEVEVADPIPFGYTTPFWKYQDGKQRAVLLVYECRLSDRPKQTLLALDHKVGAVRWCPFAKIEPTEILGGSRELIWRIAQRRREANEDGGLRKGESAYLQMENLDPKTNSRKYCLLQIEVEPESAHAYSLMRTWGRIGGKPKTISESYGTDAELRARLVALTGARLRHGYQATRVSANFPLKEWLREHPPLKTQLALWDERTGK